MSHDPGLDTAEARLAEAAELVTALSDRLEQAQGQTHEPIAITGMALRLPGGAHSPQEFWNLLLAGTDATSEFPESRGDAGGIYDNNPDAPGKAYTTRGGYLTADVSAFDPEVFRITPREAVGMDPQQRLALELGWESLENAGIAPDSLEGSATGVWMGASTTDYARLRQSEGCDEDVDAYQLMGEPSFIAGRLSFTLGLRGPSSVIDTACSSSLVALHEACASLRRRETDLALTGGVNLLLMPYGFVLMSKFRALAADGRCKTFDASADGYARAEGGVVLTLKRLVDAEASGDRVLAVVRGTAVNHDGRSSGISVPSPTAQQEVIRAALRDAGLPPEDMTYVEAHGTGTGLGDPIELGALDTVLGRSRQHPGAMPAPGEGLLPPLLVGSVKSNIGHLEPAAGVAGIAKVVLAMQHDLLPPSIHITEPNPKVPWDRFCLDLVRRARNWPAGRPRIAGVSSFGVTGTNAHVILEAPTPLPATPSATTPENAEVPESVTLSARTREGLHRSAKAWADALDVKPLRDLAWTSHTGRSRHRHGLVVTSPTSADGAVQLRAWAEGSASSATEVERAGFDEQGTGLLFTGQGAQHAGMGADLFGLPWMRPVWEDLEDVLAPRLGISVQDLLNGQMVDLEDTRWTQPALFAYEYAVARSLIDLGVDIRVVVGHSIGEISAATIAGVLELDSAAALVVARGAMMSRLPRTSGMVAVRTGENEATEMLGRWRGRLDVAGVNSPRDTVVSGFDDALAEFTEECQRRKIHCVRLPVSHGFHSPAMDPVLPELDDLASSLRQTEPSIALLSNVTGVEWPQRQETTYWSRHARGAVRFRECIAAATELAGTFVEVGPHPTLTSLGRASVDSEPLWLTVGRRGRSSAEGLTTTLGALHLRGADIDWARTRTSDARPVDAPHYPWERRSFWFPRRLHGRQGTPASSARPDQILGRRTDGAVPTWLRQDETPPAANRLSDAIRSLSRATLATGLEIPAQFRIRCRVAPQAPSGTVRTTLVTSDTHTELRIERSTDSIPRSDSRWLPGVSLTSFSPKADPLPVDGEPAPLERVTEDTSSAGVTQDLEALVERELGFEGTLEIDDLQVRPGLPVTWTRGSTESGLDVSLQDSSGAVVGQATGVRRTRERTRGTAAGSDQVLTMRWEPVPSLTGPRRSKLVLTGHPLDEERLTELRNLVDLTDLTDPAGIDIPAVAAAAMGGEDPLVLVVAPPGEAQPDPTLDLITVELVRRGGGRVRVMTQGCHETADGLVRAWPSATLWGVGRTAALEHNESWSGLVDVSPQAPAEPVAAALVYDGPEDEVLVDPTGRCYVHRLVSASELVPPRPAELPGNGTVVVTGAYGGIGQRICRWLVGAGVDELLLVSRSGADRPGRRNFIAALEDSGCHVTDVAVDVADPSALSEALNRHRASDHVITGVIHAAGVSGPQNIVDVTREEYERVWNPKVRGAYALHEATRQDPLKLFLCFSSIAATWGSQHLASYAAANAALDALCEHRAAQGLPGVALAWGPWDLPSDLYANDVMDFLVSVGLYPLCPETSMDLVDRLATSSRPGWVVSDCDWQRYVQVMETRRPRPVFEQIEPSPQATGESPTGALAAAVDPSLPEPERIAIVEDFVRNTVATTLGLPVPDVPEANLFSSGMDSLMVMEIAGHCSRATGTSVQARDLFERSRLSEWTDLLARSLGIVEDPTASSCDPADALEDPSVLVHEAAPPQDLLTPVAPHPVRPPTSVLLTGATGFLGTHILTELLARPDVSVTCLVRGADAEHAGKRLAEALQGQGLAVPDPTRLRVLPSDLAASDLGLSPERWAQLEEGTEAIVHNGAAVNFVHTFNQLRATNLDSLTTLLRHARAGGNIPLHHVSTYGVWGLPGEDVDRVLEDADLMTAGRLVTGYTQTKWAADYLARRVREAGQNVAIHRPGRVVCDAAGRTVMAGHFTTRVVQSCIELGLAPHLDFEIEITTVDYVAAAIAALALDPASLGLDYHLINPVRMPFGDLVSCLNDLGYPVRTVPREEWWARLTASDSPSRALDAVLPTVERLIVGGERAIDYDVTHSRSMLEPHGITCPPLDRSLVASLLSSLAAAGLVRTPGPPPIQGAAF